MYQSLNSRSDYLAAMGLPEWVRRAEAASELSESSAKSALSASVPASLAPPVSIVSEPSALSVSSPSTISPTLQILHAPLAESMQWLFIVSRIEVCGGADKDGVMDWTSKAAVLLQSIIQAMDETRDTIGVASLTAPVTDINTIAAALDSFSVRTGIVMMDVKCCPPTHVPSYTTKKIPLLISDNLSVLLEDPDKKRMLWHAIKPLLQSRVLL